MSVNIYDLLAMADDDGIDRGTLVHLLEESIYEDAGKDRDVLFAITRKDATQYGLVALYLSAIIAANLLVAQFGPAVTIANALLFIGLDLTTRDSLHEQWRGRGLWWKMLGLIAAGSLLSWWFNRAAGPIALASFAAFLSASLVDTLVYVLLGSRARFVKINGSNVASAAVDSLVFPVLAFGFPVLWWVVVGQFAAKTLGGLAWSVVLNWHSRKVQNVN